MKITTLFLETENITSKYMLDRKFFFLYLSAVKLNRRRASSDWQLPHLPHDVMDFRNSEFPWKDGLEQKQKVKSTNISVGFSFDVVSTVLTKHYKKPTLRRGNAVPCLVWSWMSSSTNPNSTCRCFSATVYWLKSRMITVMAWGWQWN